MILGGRQVRRYLPHGAVVVAWALTMALLPTVRPDQRPGTESHDPGAATGSTPQSTGDGSKAEPAPDASVQPAVGDASAGRSGFGRSAVGATAFPGQAPAGGSVSGAATRCVAAGAALTSAYARPCVPDWSGDNGGATFRGVTRDRVLVAELWPSGPEEKAFEAADEAAGVGGRRDYVKARKVFVDHFNKVFQLYGRRVEVIDYDLRGSDADREAMCQDVTELVEGVRVLATMWGGNNFSTCAVQRRLVGFAQAGMPERSLVAGHPYLWGLYMECERVGLQVGEYVGKRLAGRPARFAGDPQMRARPRRFGLYVPDDDIMNPCIDLAVNRLRREYGVADVVVVEYDAAQPARYADHAAQAVVRFKAEGVTTLLLACDFVSAGFLTHSATTQEWRPEWVTTGAGGVTLDDYGPTYDQSQVDRRLFGPATQPQALRGPGSEPARLYKELTGEEMANTTGGYWALLHMFDLLQAAGPNLTPASIGRGAASLAPVGGPQAPLGPMGYATRPDGSPGLDHAALDGMTEVYWDAGQRRFVPLNGGRWFTNGEWSAEEPAVPR